MITPAHSNFIWDLVRLGHSNYIIIEESKKAGYTEATEQEIVDTIEESEQQLSGCFLQGDCCR
jgi:hypothetical protein